MESTIPELAESATVLAIAVISVIVAIIKYAKTQFDEIPSSSASERESDIRRLVLSIRNHEDETVRILTKINVSLENIKDVILEDRNE